MTLAFFSGGDSKANRAIDIELLKHLPKNPCFSFIPSSSYQSNIEFREFVSRYSKFKVKKFIHFPVDVPIDKTLLGEVLKSDLIHLGGGNTFYFLKYLRHYSMLGHLKRFYLRGGVLSGLSAGAIILTKNIEMAGQPYFDRDDNFVNLTDFKSLGLVNFHFFPHFVKSKRYQDEFLEMSKRYKQAIICAPDGSGLIVKHNHFTFINRNYIFKNGESISIN
jgi:dipeptidase E